MTPESPNHLDRRQVLQAAVAGAGGWALPRHASAAPLLQGSAYALALFDGQESRLAMLSFTERPTINAGGTVAAIGTAVPVAGQPGGEAVFLAKPGEPLSVARVLGLGLTELRGPVLDADLRIGLVARRSGPLLSKAAWRGVYAMRVNSRQAGVLYEVPVVGPSTDGPAPRENLALSADGRLAFSSLRNGQGAVWRSTGLGATPQTVFTGTGMLYNSNGLGIDSGGNVAVELEYTDPIRGILCRGVLLPQPGSPVTAWRSAGERQNVGWQPPFAFGAQGAIALYNRFAITIDYHAASSGSSPTTSTLSLPIGLHLIQPAMFNQPFTFQTLVPETAGFTEVTRVLANSIGHVVFEARWNGNWGVFFGPDPVAHRIALAGQTLPVPGLSIVTQAKAGALNDQGQLALYTDHGGNARVWRVQLPPV